MSVNESETRAVIEGFPATWKRVVTDPHGFIAELPETGGLVEPATFLALCAAANALGWILRGAGIMAVVGAFVAQIALAVLLAALLVVVAQNLFDGRGGFEPMFRVVAYAWAPLVVYWVPLVGAVALVASAYLILRGLERMQRLDTVRAALTLVIAVVILGAVLRSLVWL